MKKITFIGAGSFGFTRNLVKDILTFPAFEEIEIALMDIDEERLSYIEKAIYKIKELGKYEKVLITSTTDRVKALKNADGVVITILQGGPEVFRTDIEIPKKYGVDINVGDTRGPSGIFRTLRTLPVMLDIANDIVKYCPNAIVLNYTNPMAMLCKAVQSVTDLCFTGLCHSVQGTASMLAKWIDADMDNVEYLCAGINHQAWYIKFEENGEDCYPRIRKVIEENKDIYNEEQVRNEMYLNLDYYVTESSGHNSEYNPWFRKRTDLIEKYCTNGTGWNPGEYAYILNQYLARVDNWRDDITKWLESDDIDISRGHEYASHIFNATFGDGEYFQFNGNLLNKGLIDNLPYDCCVEVPVLASKRGVEPLKVGKIPDHLAVINSLSAGCEDLAVSGALEGDKRKIYYAIAMDPLTSAVLSLEEIKNMVDEMFEANKEYLGYFKD